MHIEWSGPYIFLCIFLIYENISMQKCILIEYYLFLKDSGRVLVLKTNAAILPPHHIVCSLVKLLIMKYLYKTMSVYINVEFLWFLLIAIGQITVVESCLSSAYLYPEK